MKDGETIYLCEGRLDCDDSGCSHWSEHIQDDTCTEDTFCDVLDKDVNCVELDSNV